MAAGCGVALTMRTARPAAPVSEYHSSTCLPPTPHQNNNCVRELGLRMRTARPVVPVSEYHSITCLFKKNLNSWNHKIVIVVNCMTIIIKTVGSIQTICIPPTYIQSVLQSCEQTLTSLLNMPKKQKIWYNMCPILFRFWSFCLYVFLS